MSLVSSIGAFIDRLVLPPAGGGKVIDILSGESFPIRPELSVRIDPILTVFPVPHTPMNALPPASVAGYWVTMDMAGERVRYRVPAGEHSALLSELRRQAIDGPTDTFPDLSGLEPRE